MAGKWDSFSKLLIGARPWQYARWLVRDAEFVAALDIELKAQHLFADALLKVLLDEQSLALCRPLLRVTTGAVHPIPDQESIARSPARA